VYRRDARTEYDGERNKQSGTEDHPPREAGCGGWGENGGGHGVSLGVRVAFLMQRTASADSKVEEGGSPGKRPLGCVLLFLKTGDMREKRPSSADSHSFM